MFLTPSRLLALLGLALPLLGGLVILGGLIGGLVFHLGWRKRHPSERWPTFAMVSFGSPLVVGAGLILFNWLIVGAGVCLYLTGRYLTGRALQS